MTKEDIAAFIAEVTSKGSKLPSVDIEEYIPTSCI